MIIRVAGREAGDPSGPLAEHAPVFSRVSMRATVDRILRRARETGSVEPAPHGGGPQRLISEAEQPFVAQLVAARPDATRNELCAALAREHNIHISRATMGRELHRLGMTGKKSLVASERCKEGVEVQHKAFVERIQACDPERLIFLDESGSHVAMTRTQAWAPKGRRAPGIVPRNRGTVTTMLGALSIDGIEAMMTVEGGTTAAVFLQFIDEHLAPRLQSGDIVVMDNLGAHHAKGVREPIEAPRRHGLAAI